MFSGNETPQRSRPARCLGKPTFPKMRSVDATEAAMEAPMSKDGSSWARKVARPLVACVMAKGTKLDHGDDVIQNN
jgi:hypothetical protein